jgi:endonuclease/exonuclease/phosphatase family metal-dependent hydrolase
MFDVSPEVVVGPSRTPNPIMRLLSYNIHKGIGGRDRKYDLSRIIGVIAAAEPDVVCLQEVDRNVPRSRHDDQPAILAEALGACARLYQMNVPVKTGGYGNLLLSRWPIHTHHQVSLRLKARKPRGAQIATIETPQGLLQVVNWHLGLAEKERNWQVEHLLNHRLYRESAERPGLIAGDTNDWRERLTSAVLVRHGLRQVTYPRSRFRSFPAYLPVSALDKAFARGPIEIHRAFVLKSRMSRVASDHLPLVVDFQIGEQTLGPDAASVAVESSGPV